MASFLSSSFSFPKGPFQVILLIVFALSTTCTAQDPSIVGGRAAPPGKYPFFVQGDGCGGSLILPDVVLTAAHCVASPPPDDWPAFVIGGSVIVGNVLIDTLTPGAQVREVISAMQVHPLWDGSVFNGYDYALFQIEPVTEPGLVPVPLNFASCNPTDGETLTVMGFGLTSTGGVPSEELLEVNLSYVPNDVCQQPFAQDPDFVGVVISDTMMCADERVGEPVKAHCSGDSGGPILDDAGVQVGIVSWSKKPCGILGYPGVYARVSAEFDWIKETACELTGTNAQFCKTEISKKSKECKKSKKGMMVQMKKRNGMKSKKGMMTQMKRGME